MHKIVKAGMAGALLVLCGCSGSGSAAEETIDAQTEYGCNILNVYNAGEYIGEESPALRRRGDIIEHQLVGSAGAVIPGELYGGGDVAEPLKVHTLDDPAVFNVEAGDDAFSYHCTAFTASFRYGSACA